MMTNQVSIKLAHYFCILLANRETNRTDYITTTTTTLFAEMTKYIADHLQTIP